MARSATGAYNTMTLKWRVAFKVLRVSLLPTRASEQGNVIGLVSVYIYVCT